jgi:hypothetical protein
MFRGNEVEKHTAPAGEKEVSTGERETMSIAIDALKRIADISRPENAATDRLYQVRQIATEALQKCGDESPEAVLADLWRDLIFTDPPWVTSEIRARVQRIVGSDDGEKLRS